ncbi:hypothetical protein CHS0354_004693 [Potamilus streckersoni]|uniref:Uncharacterized protein n=1 Tax=Potamilus streckersoni TaxID=2493646 RepID=A0AAE0SHR3_9BIVA|nr:hypothetical protein CHS0354_004693 [Potamilus streckersoni]
MGTWRFEMFLFLIAVWNDIISSTQPKIDVNTMNRLTSASKSLFFKVTPSRVLSTGHTLADFSPTIRKIRKSGTSKVSRDGGDKDEYNSSTVPIVFQNGSTVCSGVLSLDVNGNCTVSPNSSHLDLNETGIDERNIIDGNNTIIQMMRNSGKTTVRSTDNFVYVMVRCGIFFGGICFIFLVGIGIYRARTRCRPKWYDQV